MRLVSIDSGRVFEAECGDGLPFINLRRRMLILQDGCGIGLFFIY
jgi:hypothetical protein